VSQDINVLALVKGNERYVFLYNEANRAETLRTLGRYASNPELSFTWYDAAILSQKIRQETLNHSKKKAVQPQTKPQPMVQKIPSACSTRYTMPLSSENELF